MNAIQDHPFSVEAFFESSLVFTFAIPKEELLRFLPPRLELDLYDDKWGFIAVAMVKTKRLRPKGFPKFLGQDFFLIGYRLFVKYSDKNGKRKRGLYILKSETDSSLMKFMGNIFTHYNYQTTDIKIEKIANSIIISSKKSAFKVNYSNVEELTNLPPESPFIDWKEARRYVGPLPFTFSVLNKGNKILIIEGVRENCIPKPLNITSYHFSFLDNIGIQSYKLANAFEITNIPYHWKKGVIEKWN